MTDVQGRCPACRGASLFLGEGGHVTCARLDCPNPCAADQLLHGETEPAACGAYQPPTAPAADQAELEDTCRAVEVDGQTIRVRGAGEMSEESRAALAEVIRAAKRKYEAEHPEASNPDGCSGEKGFCPEHGFHRHSLKQPGEAAQVAATVHELQTIVNRVREAAADQPAPSATEATATPDTITDPAYLRDLYSAAVESCGIESPFTCGEIADAVLRVRDRHLQQLRQRLRLADQAHRDDLAAEPAPAHDAGPSVRQAAADDLRWWNGEKTGEQP